MSHAAKASNVDIRDVSGDKAVLSFGLEELKLPIDYSGSKNFEPRSTVGKTYHAHVAIGTGILSGKCTFNYLIYLQKKSSPI